MTVHHIQAIGMCERVLGRETGDSVQAAATEVIRNQAIEVGMMRAWLADWSGSTAPPTTVMAWMSMDETSGGEHEGRPLADVPGYATVAEIAAASCSTPLPSRSARCASRPAIARTSESVGPVTSSPSP